MSEREPIRLRDDPEATRSLRADLARVAARPPIAYDVAAGLVRFEQARSLGAGAGAGAGTVLGAALKGALLGVVVVGGAALVEARSPPGSPGPGSVPAAVSVARAVPVRSVRPVPPPRPTVASPPGPAKLPALPEAERDVGARSVTPSTATSEAASAPPAAADPTGAGFAADAPAPAAPVSAGDALAAEMEHLARLRALEGRDPAQALALAAEGSQRFPAGQFVQEREAIAIGALVRLGRAPEARARAVAFAAAYPRSAFTERLERLTGTGGRP
jgi:hypothetical protein